MRPQYVSFQNPLSGGRVVAFEHVDGKTDRHGCADRRRHRSLFANNLQAHLKIILSLKKEEV